MTKPPDEWQLPLPLLRLIDGLAEKQTMEEKVEEIQLRRQVLKKQVEKIIEERKKRAG